MSSALSHQSSSEPAACPEHVLAAICADQSGVVHTLDGAIVEVSGNTANSRQFENSATHRFCLRLHVITPASQAELDAAHASAVERVGLEHRINSINRPVLALVLGSTPMHA